MIRYRQFAATALLAVSFVSSTTILTHAQAAPGQSPITTTQMPAFPKGKDTDVKFYDESGKSILGQAAFAKMSDAKLILWLAGNQFFAMDDVVHAFQKEHAGTTVGLITLPPGLLLQAIKSGGWTDVGGKELQIMVANGNPKHVTKIDDLARPAVVAAAGPLMNFCLPCRRREHHLPDRGGRASSATSKIKAAPPPSTNSNTC